MSRAYPARRLAVLYSGGVVDLAAAAALAAADKARTMTAATIDISCGALVDP